MGSRRWLSTAEHREASRLRIKTRRMDDQRELRIILVSPYDCINNTKIWIRTYSRLIQSFCGRKHQFILSEITRFQIGCARLSPLSRGWDVVHPTASSVFLPTILLHLPNGDLYILFQPAFSPSHVIPEGCDTSDRVRWYDSENAWENHALVRLGSVSFSSICSLCRLKLFLLRTHFKKPPGKGL